MDAPSKPPEWDGDWRLIDFDPLTQISEWWLMHDDQKSFTIRRIQHRIDAFLDANMVERNANSGKRWGEGRKVATVPLLVFEKLGLNEAVQNGDQGYLNKVLNDADNAKLRTFEGRL